MGLTVESRLGSTDRSVVVGFTSEQQNLQTLDPKREGFLSLKLHQSLVLRNLHFSEPLLTMHGCFAGAHRLVFTWPVDLLQTDMPCWEPLPSIHVPPFWAHTRGWSHLLHMDLSSSVGGIGGVL